MFRFLTICVFIFVTSTTLCFPNEDNNLDSNIRIELQSIKKSIENLNAKVKDTLLAKNLTILINKVDSFSLVKSVKTENDSLALNEFINTIKESIDSLSSIISTNETTITDLQYVNQSLKVSLESAKVSINSLMVDREILNNELTSLTGQSLDLINKLNETKPEGSNLNSNDFEKFVNNLVQISKEKFARNKKLRDKLSELFCHYYTEIVNEKRRIEPIVELTLIDYEDLFIIKLIDSIYKGDSICNMVSMKFSDLKKYIKFESTERTSTFSFSYPFYKDLKSLLNDCKVAFTLKFNSTSNNFISDKSNFPDKVQRAIDGVSKPTETYQSISSITFPNDDCYLERNNQRSDKYFDIYPYGENSTISGLNTRFSSKDESIFFMADPILRLSFFNNFHKGLETGENFTFAIILNFSPSVRMYNYNSSPILMPNFKVSINPQLMWYIDSDSKNHQFCGIDLNWGHYSNGQLGHAFDSTNTLPDPNSSDSIYKSITKDTELTTKINRIAGNFDIKFFYRIDGFYKWLNTSTSSQKWNNMITLGIGSTFYQLASQDKGIFPACQIHFKGEYFHVFSKHSESHIFSSFSLNSNFDYNIGDFNNTIKNYRFTARLTVNPYIFKNEQTGFFVEYINGFDNYNLRMVDHVNAFHCGFSWSIMTPTIVNYPKE